MTGPTGHGSPSLRMPPRHHRVSAAGADRWTRLHEERKENRRPFESTRHIWCWVFDGRQPLGTSPPLRPFTSEGSKMIFSCNSCEDTGWVCEAHQNRPWNSGAARSPCICGAPGMPCSRCNAEEPPRTPPGFRVAVDVRIVARREDY